jgi:hypothetical protein
MTAPPPSDEPRARWGVVGWVIVLSALGVGFWAFPLKTIGPGATHLPGDAADNRLNNYVLEHGHRYLRGLESSFWNAPMFYPTAGTTATSDAHLGMLPLYSALRAGGLSPEEAFQGYFLIPFALNFASAAWAIRRLGFGPTAAAVGAYVFSFSLPLAAQLVHAQLFPRFLVPPALVIGWEHLREPKPWRAWVVVGCVVAQVYISAYIGYLLVLTPGGRSGRVGGTVPPGRPVERRSSTRMADLVGFGCGDSGTGPAVRQTRW